MYRINLLPESFKQYLKSQLIKNRIIVVEGILLIALLFIYWILTMIGTARALEHASVAEENKALQAQVDSLKQYDTNNSMYNTDAFIDDVIGSYPDLEQYLIRIANSIPDGVVISGFNVGSGDMGETGTISGSASDYEEVSNWIKDISKIKGLANVKTTYLAKDKNNEDNGGEPGEAIGEATGEADRILYEISVQIVESEPAADTEG